MLLIPFDVFSSVETHYKDSKARLRPQVSYLRRLPIKRVGSGFIYIYFIMLLSKGLFCTYIQGFSLYIL